MSRFNSRAATALAATIVLTGSLFSAARAAQETTVVTPPGSTTRVHTTPNGDTVIAVTVNNESVSFDENSRPRMMGGRVMVPLRGVVEKLGGNILYDKKSNVITGAHAASKNQFRLRVGASEALLNGKNMVLDTPPRVIAGITYVPLRFVSEAMGAAVSWDNARQTVVIDTEDGTAEVKTGR